jgi:hypothetical protein
MGCDMENGEFLVDLVNEKGEVVGQKRRSEIDKRSDIFHSVQVLMVTPQGEVVMSIIPSKTKLEMLYADHIGLTAYTIRRTDENSDEAAVRALSRDLFIDDPVELHWIGERFHTFKDGHQTYVTLYYLVGDAPKRFRKDGAGGIVTMSSKKLRKHIAQEPDKFAPNFLGIWETYADDLPL